LPLRGIDIFKCGNHFPNYPLPKHAWKFEPQQREVVFNADYYIIWSVSNPLAARAGWKEAGEPA